MCGLLGGINIPRLDAVLPDLLGRIAHRGPDASGTYHHDGPAGPVALGHRRLSIIDLSSAADQPFRKDGLVLVFNGEIYNYRALTAELAQQGAAFRTRSDTEVVLEAWRHWGAEGLRRLRGMFAFALYEETTGRLVLARDPFGIKPLYVLQADGGVAFSSELKALVPLLGDSARIDDGAVLASLVYSWLPDEYCLYRNVAKLPAGHWLEVLPGGRAVQRRLLERAGRVAAAGPARCHSRGTAFYPGRFSHPPHGGGRAGVDVP